MAEAGGCNGGSVCGRGDCSWWGEMAVGEGYVWAEVVFIPLDGYWGPSILFRDRHGWRGGWGAGGAGTGFVDDVHSSRLVCPLQYLFLARGRVVPGNQGWADRSKVVKDQEESGLLEERER
jgi:hypothetical protein